MNPKSLFTWIFPALLAFAPVSHAQWLTQSFDLKPGWNAAFLHVDASHATFDALVGADINNPILEIWRWNPPSTTQFADSPANHTAGSEWTSWVRSQTGGSLQRPQGDAAYLVRVGTNVANYTWSIKGHPVAPRQELTITGLNFIGFSTVTNNPPKFNTFLAQSPELQVANPEIYYYPGGDLGANNPLRLLPSFYRNTPVKRGQAFWVRSGTVFNRYFGPFEVEFSSASGVNFSDRLSTYNFRLRNLTATNLTVTLRLVNSETNPPGQTIIADVPPLLVRGSLNLTNLTYGYANLPTGSSRQWTLAARDHEGSEVEVVLGLDRTIMTGNVGDLLAGILRFTDSLGISQVDAPVSATVNSSAGLWVGGAAVTQVGEYLKSYLHGASTPLLVTNADNVVTNDLTITTNGQYVVSSISTNLGAVPTAFPLRLIVHNPTSVSAVLLQRVYYGLNAATNPIVATKEAALNRAFLSEARRISAPHLPWSQANNRWSFNGPLSPHADLTASVTTAFNNQAVNPFLHTYHPDHDNLDAQFQHEEPQGVESYTIVRDIRLRVTPPGNDFASRTAGGLTLTGDYLESIRMLGLARAGGTNDTRQFEVRGVFSLNHISDVPVLTSTP